MEVTDKQNTKGFCYITLISHVHIPPRRQFGKCYVSPKTKLQKSRVVSYFTGGLTLPTSLLYQ